MYRTLVICCCMTLLLACSDGQELIESKALSSPSFNNVEEPWQFEAIRDRVVVEQCEKLEDPDAFQPDALDLD